MLDPALLRGAVAQPELVGELARSDHGHGLGGGVEEVLSPETMASALWLWASASR
jgi:hypothetical protein